MPFLKNYMLWNEGTEVPTQYYFWSGISALAALVNGQVYTRMGRYEIYPNMYIVLLGPPGNGKTSAMRRSEKLIRGFEDISLSAQSETAEGLVRFMRDKCVRPLPLPDGNVDFTPVTCFLSELSNFFGRDPGGMIDVLTGIWDCGGDNFHRRTKGQGEDILPRPNLNLLGCTTQDWITTYLKSDIIGGGFTRRVVFVNEMMGDDTHRVPRPMDTPQSLTALSNCQNYGRVLRDIRGEMIWDTPLTAYWDKWYCTRTIPREPDVRGYHKTKPVLVLKVAMLVALSERPEKLIRISDMEMALALLEATEQHLLKVFQGIGRNELNAVAYKIQGILEAAPEKGIMYEGRPCKAKVMHDKMLYGLMAQHANIKELQDIFQHMQLADKIFKFSAEGGRIFIGLKESIRAVPQGDKTAEEKK
jgi:hypothetical protein